MGNNVLGGSSFTGWATSTTSKDLVGVVTIENTTEATFCVPGIYDWTVPTGITSISTVCIGGGGANGGQGGSLVWNYNYPVTEGTTLKIVVGSGGTLSSTWGSDSAIFDRSIPLTSANNLTFVAITPGYYDATADGVQRDWIPGVTSGVPVGVFSVSAVAIGAGGAGGSGSGGITHGAGGGGGGLAYINNLYCGDGLKIQASQTTNSGSGGDSIIYDSTGATPILVGGGGAGGVTFANYSTSTLLSDTPAGGAGGVNTSYGLGGYFSGGTGGRITSGNLYPNSGGGGGGAAGFTANGGAGGAGSGNPATVPAAGVTGSAVAVNTGAGSGGGGGGKSTGTPFGGGGGGGGTFLAYSGTSTIPTGGTGGATGGGGGGKGGLTATENVGGTGGSTSVTGAAGGNGSPLGGGGGGSAATAAGGSGGNGAVRLIWPGNTRSYPSTNTQSSYTAVTYWITLNTSTFTLTSGTPIMFDKDIAGLSAYQIYIISSVPFQYPNTNLWAFQILDSKYTTSTLANGRYMYTGPGTINMLYPGVRARSGGGTSQSNNYTNYSLSGTSGINAGGTVNAYAGGAAGYTSAGGNGNTAGTSNSPGGGNSTTTGGGGIGIYGSVGITASGSSTSVIGGGGGSFGYNASGANGGLFGGGGFTTGSGGSGAVRITWGGKTFPFNALPTTNTVITNGTLTSSPSITPANTSVITTSGPSGNIYATATLNNNPTATGKSEFTVAGLIASPPTGINSSTNSFAITTTNSDGTVASAQPTNNTQSRIDNTNNPSQEPDLKSNSMPDNDKNSKRSDQNLSTTDAVANRIGWTG